MFFMGKERDNKAEHSKIFFIPIVEKIEMEHQSHLAYPWCLAKLPNVVRHFYPSLPTYREAVKSNCLGWYKVSLNTGQQAMLERIEREGQTVFQAALAFNIADIESCIILNRNGSHEFENPYYSHPALDDSESLERSSPKI
ncbi:hypothetical protein Lspi_0371 [Legionella spiritensis]|uniref:Uncharacterized protein n=2 Tax=Legionella spiritensis TaxID=452 RepID=A0A0W0Z973_LEGSP|nr:hypothetical protein Lspi_0371 [Legionella spiritensis]SNV43697.1 Uncharacterised protein [Legionella spiritensis]